MTTLIEKDNSKILHASPGEDELIDQRTRTAKVFNAGNRRYRIGASLAPIHYRENPFDKSEPFKEIDLAIKLTPDKDWDAACETNGYQIRIWNSRPAGLGMPALQCVAQFRRAGRWFAMAPHSLWWENGAGERQEIGGVAAVGSPLIDNEAGTVTWRDVFGAGLDWRYNLWPDRFFKTAIIQQRKALPQPTIGSAGLRLTLVLSVAWDATTRPANGFTGAEELSGDIAEALTQPDEILTDPEPFAHLDEQQRKLWWLQTPMAWDSAEPRNEYQMQWRFVRKHDRIFLLLSIPAAVLNAATYPVFLDAAISEEQIQTGSDDGHSYSNSYPGTTLYATGSNVCFGATSTNFYCGGFRFQTIPIPRGAIILSAAITGTPYTSDGASLDVYIEAEDVDDGATWSSSHKPSDAHNNRTSAQARWTTSATWSVGNWYESPDLASVVQEIINRSGWSPDNDLNFVLPNVSTSLPASNQRRNFKSYDSYPSEAAKFTCLYRLAFDALLLAGD